MGFIARRVLLLRTRQPTGVGHLGFINVLAGADPDRAGVSRVEQWQPVLLPEILSHLHIMRRIGARLPKGEQHSAASR